MIIFVTDPYFNEKTKALNSLYHVIDPELFVNVVDLGMIYEIDFLEDNLIHVLMTLSTPHCPMGEAITNGVKNAIEKEFPDHKVETELTFDPAWSFEMLTEEGKKLLGVS